MAAEARRGDAGADSSPSASIRGRHLGDHKQLDGGVWEARLVFGPGYRLYFGKDGAKLILLLMGGDKGSQSKDIKLARQLWAKYTKEVGNNDKTK